MNIEKTKDYIIGKMIYEKLKIKNRLIKNESCIITAFELNSIEDELKINVRKYELEEFDSKTQKELEVKQEKLKNATSGRIKQSKCVFEKFIVARNEKRKKLEDKKLNNLDSRISNQKLKTYLDTIKYTLLPVANGNYYIQKGSFGYMEFNPKKEYIHIKEKFDDISYYFKSNSGETKAIQLAYSSRIFHDFLNKTKLERPIPSYRMRAPEILLKLGKEEISTKGVQVEQDSIIPIGVGDNKEIYSIEAKVDMAPGSQIDMKQLFFPYFLNITKGYINSNIIFLNYYTETKEYNLIHLKFNSNCIDDYTVIKNTSYKLV